MPRSIPTTARWPSPSRTRWCFPADTAQTAAVVRLASEAGVAYVPRGFGTNLSGGTIASQGGLVIGLTRLNRILAIEPEGRYAVVQAGVTNLELQQALAPRGFLFAPDPASQKAATLGGNLAENAGGPHCVKYGVTTNHVLGVTAVLPGGEVLQIGGPALDPPGYDLRGVLVGSEGTLAVVTEMAVRILPSAESLLTMLVVYDDVADAARSVSAIVAAGMTPATLEMMDGAVIRAVEASKPCGYPLDAAAVLIVEVDGPLAGLAQQAERIGQLCLQNGCREVRKAKDAAERDLLWAGRRGAFGAIARLAPSFLVADCTVPRTRLPDALAQVAADRPALSTGPRQRLSCRRRQSAPGDPVRPARSRSGAAGASRRTRDHGSLRGLGRHHQRRTRRGDGEAGRDAAGVLGGRLGVPAATPSGLRSAGPAQSRQAAASARRGLVPAGAGRFQVRRRFGMGSGRRRRGARHRASRVPGPPGCAAHGKRHAGRFWQSGNVRGDSAAQHPTHGRDGIRSGHPSRRSPGGHVACPAAGHLGRARPVAASAPAAGRAAHAGRHRGAERLRPGAASLRGPARLAAGPEVHLRHAGGRSRPAAG